MYENSSYTDYDLDPLSAILQCADEISTILGDFRASGSNVIDETVLADSIDAAQTIALCAQHQKRIVDDVLTLSKLDSAMLMVRIRFDFREIFANKCVR